MARDRNFKLDWRTVFSAALLFLTLWFISWWLNRTISIFVSDTGLRFIQIRELIANGWQTVAIAYPARVFDPDLIHVPYYHAYSLVGDQIFLNITPFMPWLASWGYVAIGVPGITVVPVLGGVLTALAVFRLAQLSRLSHCHLILWLAVFATPLFFYSIELWDHTLATAAATWSVYWLARGLVYLEEWWMIPLAGMTAGVGLGQRPEMYLFALCLGAGILIVRGWAWRPLLLLVLGGAITTMPLWLWQYKVVGHPLGMAVAANLLGYGLPSVAPEGASRFPWYLRLSRKLFVVDAQDAHTFLATLAVMVGLVSFILSVRIIRWQRPWLWRLTIAAMLTGYLLFLVKTLEPYPLNGVVATFPLIAITTLYVDRSQDKQPARKVYELVFSVSFLFLVGMVILWPAYGGLQWGWRYALPFCPLAIYLAFYSYQTLRSAWPDWQGAELRRLMIMLVIASLLLQLAGFYMQIARHQENGAVRDGVAALPAEVVITNAKYLSSEAASLENKTFLYVKDSAALETVITRLWQQNVTQFAVVQLMFIPLIVPQQVGELSIHETAPFMYELTLSAD
jgi:hypothetical protein